LVWQSNAREKAAQEAAQKAEQARTPQSQVQAPASGPTSALPPAAAGPGVGGTAAPRNTHSATKSTSSNSESGGASGTTGTGSGPPLANGAGSLSVGSAQSIRVYIHAADPSQATLVQGIEGELAHAGVLVAGFDVRAVQGHIEGDRGALLPRRQPECLRCGTDSEDLGGQRNPSYCQAGNRLRAASAANIWVVALHWPHR
jgi:hypothetical protein